MRKIIALMLSVGLSVQGVLPAHALTDEMILADPVQYTYSGRPEVTTMIQNLNFTDLPSGFWAKEAIVQSGALGVVKGYDRTYSPSINVSNEEALAFALRLIGKETEAQQLAATLQAAAPADSPLRTMWSIGYLNLASQMGLITAEDYTAVVEPEKAAEQTTEGEEGEAPEEIAKPEIKSNFVRTDPASREMTANWVYRALQSMDSTIFSTTESQQSIYRYTDFDMIAVDKAEAVDALARNNIMGVGSTTFRPKDSLTRAEMAQVVANLDSIYNRIWGLEKKTGTIGAVQDAQYTNTNAGRIGRRFYIRRSDGTVEMFLYEQQVDSSPQAGTWDAVVYKNGNVNGLTTLSEGDVVEYIVNPKTQQVYYVQVLQSVIEKKKVSGKLVSVNTNAETPGFETTGPAATASSDISITISDSDNKNYTYSMITSAIVTSVNGVRSLVIDGKPIALKELPIGAVLELELINNVVERINYIGQPTLVNEMQGIVLENNPGLGYLVILDSNKNMLTKYYNSGDIKVEKQQYYDMQDEIGYYDEMFPNFNYDPRDTIISDIEPGDIVYITTANDDPSYISHISAVTNYIMKYGKIRSFTTRNGVSSMLVEYEDKQQGWFDVAHNIFLSRDSRPIEFSDVQVGDWVKLLVNQAIIEPGYIIESVKEMTIEGDEHFISTILKGKVSLINNIQNQMTLQNVYELQNTQWGNYQDLRQVSLSGNDIEYYYNGQRISLDYVNQFLKRSTGDVYVALENNFAGERVKKVTFRNERDSLLTPDIVVNADGSGNFGIVSVNGQISTDQGTIVRRFGRLVDGKDILTPDYALVALNGQSKAAVVDIEDAPGMAAVSIARGRILSVDEGRSFKVQSMSMFTGSGWSYTPIQREFTIDHETLFLNANGSASIDTFIDYSNTSVYNRVYNIVIDGTRAAQVIDAPYAQRYVRGTIYQTDGSTAYIKDVTYYDTSSFRWRSLSTSNSSATVRLHPNTVIAKQNKVILSTELEVGDQIKASLVELPEQLVGGIMVDAYIVQVEK